MILEKLKKEFDHLVVFDFGLDKILGTKGKSPIQSVRSIKISSQENI